MFRKLLCAGFVMTLAVAFVAADEFTATITAVKDGKVTYQKFKKGDKKGERVKDGDPVTLPVTEKATIANAKGFGKKAEVGDKIDDGLKNEIFTKIGEKGVAGRITTDEDNKNITRILVFGKKKAAN